MSEGGAGSGAGRARVLSRRGLRRGAHSSLFSVTELAEAGRKVNQDNVYIEMDGSGQLTGGGGGGGVARAVRQARLAPAPPHASALLCLEPASLAPAPHLRLVTRADVPPLHDLHLWFDEHILARLDMPFLTLRNIAGKKNYTCHNCDAEFEHPNPLKIHMFLSCRSFEPDAFWRRCIEKLQATMSPAAPLVQTALLPSVPSAVTDPAQLEALAAAWGRSRDGHICLYCGKLYSRKYGLKIHIRTHTGYKPLRCRHCYRAFGDPSNLNKHVRLHASAGSAGGGGGGGGGYSCSLCRKPLARRRDLQRHMRAHHPHHQHTSNAVHNMRMTITQ